MSALHHMASPRVLWREKPGQHQWLVLHSIPLHPSALCCEKPTKGRLKWKQNTRCPPCVWTCLGQESVCFLLWFWFSGLFRLVLSRRQKFNWLCLVLRRNQELEFGSLLDRSLWSGSLVDFASSWWRLFATGTRKESVRSSQQLDKCFLIECRPNLSDPWLHSSNPCQLVRCVTQV